MKKDLFDALKEICTFQNQISHLFGDCEQLGSPITIIAELIMEKYGFETENELVFEQLMNFADGDITKEKLIEKYLTQRDIS